MNKLIIISSNLIITPTPDECDKSVMEWMPFAGSAKAIADLFKAGFQIAVFTNQRQCFTPADINAMHDKMRALTEAEGGYLSYFMQPHNSKNSSDSLAPLPGLIHQIEEALNASAKGAWMVGDALEDVHGGAGANCKVALIKTGKGENTLERLANSVELKGEKIYIFDDVVDFSKAVLR